MVNLGKKESEKMSIASLFSGAGGLDLGFKNSGFNLIYANDYDKDVWETFEKNHRIKIDKRSICNIKSNDIPKVDGIIGGPPCQSWSLAGSMKGINDKRGKLFYEYIRILEDKKPLFFVAENVAGILSKTHIAEFLKIIDRFKSLGYNVSYKLVNAKNYNVPQERKRVIIVGYRNDLNKTFSFPEGETNIVSLRDIISNLPDSIEAREKNKPNSNLKIVNHEHMNGGFSTMYMSRNRKKDWNEVSFTIQAGGRHSPLHPSSPSMIKKDKDLWIFNDKEKSQVRRLSVRECARIQTFPDDFRFYYDNVAKGYKMIGNAVPVNLAESIAKKIKNDLQLETKRD